MKLPKRIASYWAKLKPRERKPGINSVHYQSLYWKKKRESFWRKPENQICAHCGIPRQKFFTCDHIKPVPRGCDLNEFILFTEENGLQALCQHCNAVKTAKDK